MWAADSVELTGALPLTWQKRLAVTVTVTIPEEEALWYINIIYVS